MSRWALFSIHTKLDFWLLVAHISVFSEMEHDKPHTRHKAKLMAQKRVVCAECSTMTYKRHTMQCLHSFCPKCFAKLRQLSHRHKQGVRCPVCNSFDPYTPYVERDDSHLMPCKLHPNKKYIFYCLSCQTMVCYSCKVNPFEVFQTF